MSETPRIDPKLLNIPTSFQTDRLLIRMPRVGDGGFINPSVLESIDELRPWMPWAQQCPTLDQSEIHIRTAIAKWISREDLHLLCFLKGTDTFVIGSGLHRIDWNVPRFEIGYWCRSSHVGQGYVTEAVRGIARFALDDLKANRVEIRCDDRNLRSAAVAERAGFVLEGVLRNASRAIDGTLADMRVYALTPRG